MILDMWVIYDRPEDYPMFYVARKWIVAEGELSATHTTMMSTCLQEVRDMLTEAHPGLAMVPPEPNDDPCVLEVWL